MLEYLHTRKPAIIYRDLKPGNIMLRPDGTITLIDFGTAREYKEQNTSDTSYLGTRGYAAPEQFGGMGQTDARTDIYCLGATLYHLVTGHNPSEPPYEFYPIRYWNQQLSPGLEYIINKCVQNNPADRYQSCAEVMYDLQNYKELDKSYKKEARFGIALFGLVAAGAIVFAGLGLSFHAKATQLPKENYEYYVNEAISTVDEMTASEMFAKAIVMDPGNPTAYLELLDNTFLVDDNFSPEEEQMLRQILITPSGGTTVEKRLSADKEGYARVAYRIGIAYFYCYNEVGNKQMSAKWFQTAASQGTLSPAQQFRAEKLGKIAQYYTGLGTESKSGDSMVSYRQFWDDLVGIAEGNIAEVDNAVTAIMIYKEIANQIYTYPANLMKAGVTYEEMCEEMDYILAHIESDVYNDPNITDSTRQLASDAVKSFAIARKALDTAAGK